MVNPEQGGCLQRERGEALSCNFYTRSQLYPCLQQSECHTLARCTPSSDIFMSYSSFLPFLWLFSKPDAERIFWALQHHRSLMKADLHLGVAGRASSKHRAICEDTWTEARRERQRLEAAHGTGQGQAQACGRAFLGSSSVTLQHLPVADSEERPSSFLRLPCLVTSSCLHCLTSVPALGGSSRNSNDHTGTLLPAG